MSTYNLYLVISSIFFLFLTNFAVQIRSDEAWEEMWTFPEISHPYAEWRINDIYALSSPFETNLIRVMKSLAQNTSQTGFNVSSYGQDHNRVYGLLQCIGNTSQSQCRQCTQNVTRYVIDGNCFQSVSCQIWFDSCYVRYANYSFFSIYETFVSFASSAQISVNYSKSPDVFRETLGNLLSSLSAEVSRYGTKGFAVDSANYSTPSLEKIDAFVECSRDLSSANCSACLAKIESNRIENYLQQQMYDRSCRIGYVSTESAYAPMEWPSASAESPSAPTESPSASTEMGNSASRMLTMMWVVIGGLLLSSFSANY